MTSSSASRDLSASTSVGDFGLPAAPQARGRRLGSPARTGPGRRFGFARRDDEDEFALDALRFGEQPCGRLAELHPRHLFELFRELAGDRDLALRAEALGEVTHGLEHPVRRLTYNT